MLSSRFVFAFFLIAHLSYHPHYHVKANQAIVSSSPASASDLVVGGAENADVDVVSNYPLRCLVRQFNFTASVTDANGKRCRGQVSTKACFGSCDSYEVGTFEFPWIVRVQPVCNYDGVVMKEVRLSDCDPGVDSGALVYRFPEASSCSCRICNPSEQACETSPSKRSAPLVEDRGLSRTKNSIEDDYDANSVYSNSASMTNEDEQRPIATISFDPVFDGRMSGWLAWSQLRQRRN